jgi:hypothetical protein
MLDSMASPWRTLQRRLGKAAENLVFKEGPKIISQGVRIGLEALAARVPESPVREITTGRPVTKNSVPTAFRARKISYAPDLDGRADPGEVVWTWVKYEDDPHQGKDRPVLVIGRDDRTLLGLMLSSQSERDGQRNWLALGAGAWDQEERPSWIRLDRILEVDQDGIRREGAVLDPVRFSSVADELRRDYGWH